MASPDQRRLFEQIATATAILLIAGCGDGGRATVTGTLTTSDGAPLVGARVTARSNSTGNWATAVTNEQGYFSLGREKEGDGVTAGDYYVVVVEDRGDWDNPRPPLIHPKYDKGSTSGLGLQLQSGDRTTMDLRLELP